MVCETTEVLAGLPDDDAWLTPSERTRLEAMQHPHRRAQFRAGHGLARQLLARAEGARDWRAWSLSCSAHGAPLSQRDGQPVTRQVSIAHSGPWLACATAPHPLGVDIESGPRPRELLELARSLYPPHFVAELEACDEQERRSRFYRRWTLDEAHAKMSGRGLLRSQLRTRAWETTGPLEASALSWDLEIGWLALSVPPSTRSPARLLEESPPVLKLPAASRPGTVRCWRMIAA